MYILLKYILYVKPKTCVVPIYIHCIHSIMHDEYVLGIEAFLLVQVAVASRCYYTYRVVCRGNKVGSFWGLKLQIV